MIWLKIIFIIGILTVSGVVIDAIIATSCNGPLRETEGFEFEDLPVHQVDEMLTAATEHMWTKAIIVYINA